MFVGVKNVKKCNMTHLQLCTKEYAFVRFQGPPSASVRAFKSSHPPTHLLLLFVLVMSEFAECDTYPSTLKITECLCRNH